MTKLKLLLGWLKHFFYYRVSLFSLVSSDSIVDKSVSIYRGVKIKKARIRKFTYVSANTVIENAEIGMFCSIADHCRIGMATHTLDYLSTSPLFTQKNNACRTSWSTGVRENISQRVIIGNDVWVGSHSLILGGVRIGDGAVIGAGAVVTKDIPPYSIVGGVPAKVIRYRFSESIIEELLKTQWWDYPEEELRQKIGLFQSRIVTLDIIKELNHDNT